MDHAIGGSMPPLLEFVSGKAECANNHPSVQVIVIIHLLARPDNNYSGTLDWVKTNCACPTCQTSDYITLTIDDPTQ